MIFFSNLLNLLKLFNLASIVNLALTITGFCAVVAIHEFGHFLFCKLFGISAPTFSIGAGPSIFEKKFGETNFKIGMLPFGGYVEIENDENDLTNPKNFNNSPYWQKMAVGFGGIFFNLLSAAILYSGINYFYGQPTRKLAEIAVLGVQENGAANNILAAGDKIIGLGGSLFKNKSTTLEDFSNYVVDKKGAAAEFTILKDGQEENITISVPQSEKTIGILGIDIEPRLDTELHFKPVNNIVAAVKEGIQTVWLQFKTISQGMLHIFKNKKIGALAGPIKIVTEGFKSASQGIINLLLTFGLISVNLALLNLIPLGALDGGQLLTVTIEAILQRRLTMFKQILNVVSLILLLGLMLFLSFKEIADIATSLIAKLR